MNQRRRASLLLVPWSIRSDITGAGQKAGVAWREWWSSSGGHAHAERMRANFESLMHEQNWKETGEGLQLAVGAAPVVPSAGEDDVALIGIGLRVVLRDRLG
jgi:hypothetical protein